MRAIVTSVVAVFIAACAMAESALPITPESCKEITEFADIWINGGKPIEANLGTDKCEDSFSKELMRILAQKPDKKEFKVKYQFDVKKAASYKFYAALIHQGRPYGSPVEFRFDDGEWQKIVPIKGKRISWGVSSAINWEPLGIHKLTAGPHTVEFRFNKKTPKDRWSFMCDGVIGLEQGKKKD